MNSDSKTITLTKEVNAQEFFENLLGTAWETWYWWHRAEFCGGYSWDIFPEDFDEPFLTVGICDPEDENEEATITKTLTLNDLVRAYEKNPRVEWDNHDAISADSVLQTAVFGEVVYG